MKLLILSSFLLFLSVEIYHTRRISTPQNIIRVPLKRIHPTLDKLKVGNTDSPKVPLVNDKPQAYGNISLGTEPQLFRVLFDTGSDALWVYSSGYESINEIRKHGTYNHNASSTYYNVSTDKPSYITYVTGNVSGYWSADTVSVGGIETDEEFIEVTSADETARSFTWDGVMGLRYNSMEGNIVTKICNQTGGENKFSYYLPKYDSESDDGEIILCGEDQSKYKAGTMNFIEAVSPLGLWFIPVDSIQLRHNEQILEKTINATVLLDTGTNRIAGPKEIIDKWFKHIKPERVENFVGDNKFDCENLHLLPNLTFGINGKNYVLEARDYFEKVQISNNPNDEFCLLVIIPLEFDFWILGDVFIRKFYTVFDIENNRIGFADVVSDEKLRKMRGHI